MGGEDCGKEDRMVRKIKAALKVQVEMGRIRCDVIVSDDYPVISGRLDIRRMARDLMAGRE